MSKIKSTIKNRADIYISIESMRDNVIIAEGSVHDDDFKKYPDRDVVRSFYFGFTGGNRMSVALLDVGDLENLRDALDAFINKVTNSLADLTERRDR